MHFRTIYLLLLLSAPAIAQPVLTITDARKANPVAPYVYFREDFTHKLTYEQVARFPLDSFQRVSTTDVLQLGYRRGTVWMRFSIQNQTSDELFLISSFRYHVQWDVFVQYSTGRQTNSRSGLDAPAAHKTVFINPPVIPLGKHPQTVFIQLRAGNAYGEYLHIGNLEQAITYLRQTTRWQSLALGVFLLAFVYAFAFFIRLRTPLLGWYTLLLFSIIWFYLEYYDFLSDYTHENIWNKYVHISSSFVYELCWALFHVKFLNLRHYSPTLYWAIIGLTASFWINLFISKTSLLLTGTKFSPLYQFLNWLGIDWGGHILIVLLLMLIALIYVCTKNFWAVFLYAVAFSISLVGMIVSMFALYDITWLPYLPYNNLFVPATLIEVVMLGYILAEQHRRQQNQTQQQLITQLQENLRQRDQLLHIRDEIARDLNDEVGATLTAIATSTKLVQKKINGQQPDIIPILQQIQTDSRQTILSLRETVWALNPDNDGPDKLLERLRAVAHQLLAPAGIALTFVNEVALSELPDFSMAQRRNLYLVVKEALHNIVKHAQATRADVLIDQQGNELQLRIADNGQGFELGKGGEGNGLKNFQKRALEGSFAVTVQSELGEGTVVEVRVPISSPIQTNHSLHHDNHRPV